MDKKIYKFSYGGRFKKFISKTVSLVYNFFAGCIFLLIYAFILTRINGELELFLSEKILHVIEYIEVYAGVATLLIFIIMSFLPQKAVITPNKIKIYRHYLFLNPLLIFRGFNDNIQINKIEKIYRPESKDKFLKPIPVNVIDWKNMVLIEAGLRTYYVPLEKSDEFIAEVNKRISESKDKTDK